MRAPSISPGCCNSCGANIGVRRVACEGGAELFRSLLELQLVDQLNLTIAPYIFGGKGAPTLTGREQRISPGERALFVSRNAHRRRRMLRRIPAKIFRLALAGQPFPTGD